MASFSVCVGIYVCKDIFLIYKIFHPQNITPYKWKMSQQHKGFAFKVQRTKKLVGTVFLEQILSSLTRKTSHNPSQEFYTEVHSLF